MRRRVISTPAATLEVGSTAAEEMRAWAMRPEKKTRSKRAMSGSSMMRATEQLDRMVAAEDWAEATPKHFVALYTRLHIKVYGVEPTELGPTERMYAAAACGRMLRAHMGGNNAEMAEFMRWAWRREASSEKWRRDNGREGRRLTWRLLFGGALLTDWRLDIARRAKGG